VDATLGNSLASEEFDRHTPIEHTYYNHGGVTVTNRWLTVNGQRHDVSRLDALRTVRGAYPPVVATISWVAVVAVFTVMVSFPFIYREPALWLGVMVVSIVPVAAAIVARRLQPRSYELWARYHGLQVRLLWIPDERTYDDVCRALIWAREARPEHARVLPPAA
jgi:hypothetical protein